MREGHKIPRTRSRFTSGIMHWALMPSAFPDTQLSDSGLSRTTGFKVSMAFLAAVLGATSRSSLMSPLPCGKSMANTLIFPDAPSGSETVTKSACITWRIFAAIARKTSRRSRLDVILLVRFSSNWSRSF